MEVQRKKYIRDDLRWGKNVKIFMTPQIRFIRAKRRCEYWKSRSLVVYMVMWMIYRHYETKYNTDIPAAVQLGKGFKIRHLGNIVVNPNVKIGDNVDILNGVLLGQSDRGPRKGCPEIGSRVFIGTNAIVVGKIHIGSDVIIAPGAYVNFDVPDHSIVIGNPGQIIYKKNASEGYIENPIEDDKL